MIDVHMNTSIYPSRFEGELWSSSSFTTKAKKRISLFVNLT